jgi:acetylcholinesterase
VYDGSILSSTQNVIVISIEYRVDSLGFLYLGTSGAPGNQGLYDQLLAFEWIYKNIKNFGGDPQRITLFGESAGGVSIGLHMLSPKTRHLFTNAILQSSGPTAKWAVLEPHIAKYRSERFLNNLTNYIIKHYEAGPTDPEYIYTPEQCQKPLITMEDKFLCVKNYPILSHDHFVASWGVDSYNGGPIGYSFVPTIDSDFIPYDPEQMLIKGDYKKCPILLGVNQDEGTYFNIYVPQGNMSIDTWAYVDYETFQKAIREYFQYIPIFPTKSTPIILESILQTYTKWDDYNNTVQNAIQLSFAVGKKIYIFNEMIKILFR